VQRSEAFAEYQKRLQVSGHRLARLVQLGIRQARYFGRLKTFLASLHQHFISAAKIIATTLKQFLAAIHSLKESTLKTLVWLGGFGHISRIFETY